MAFLNGVVKRLVKGSALTAAEGDNNLALIDQALGDLSAAPTSPAPDNVTIEVSGGAYQLKDAGISSGIPSSKYGAGSVLAAAMGADAILPVSVKSGATSVASAGGNATIDWSLGFSFYGTLTENTTYAFSNTKDGQSISIAITQAASVKTVTWPSVKWSGGVAPTMSVGSGKVDVYTFIKVNGVFYGAVLANCA